MWFCSVSWPTNCLVDYSIMCCTIVKKTEKFSTHGIFQYGLKFFQLLYSILLHWPGLGPITCPHNVWPKNKLFIIICCILKRLNACRRTSKLSKKGWCSFVTLMRGSLELSESIREYEKEKWDIKGWNMWEVSSYKGNSCNFFAAKLHLHIANFFLVQTSLRLKPTFGIRNQSPFQVWYWFFCHTIFLQTQNFLPITLISTFVLCILWIWYIQIFLTVGYV